MKKPDILICGFEDTSELLGEAIPENTGDCIADRGSADAADGLKETKG